MLKVLKAQKEKQENFGNKKSIDIQIQKFLQIMSI